MVAQKKIFQLDFPVLPMYNLRVPKWKEEKFGQTKWYNND